jgi:arsenate reductase (thioredoxin)
MLDRFRAVRDEIELRMKTWLEHREVELARLREERDRERQERLLEAERRGETTPVGGAGYEGHDPFRRV